MTPRIAFAVAAGVDVLALLFTGAVGVLLLDLAGRPDPADQVLFLAPAAAAGTALVCAVAGAVAAPRRTRVAWWCGVVASLTIVLVAGGAVVVGKLLDGIGGISGVGDDLVYLAGAEAVVGAVAALHLLPLRFPPR